MARDPTEEVIEGWPKPDFTDPVYRGKTLSIVVIVFAAVNTAVVFLRFYTRAIYRRNFWLDDWFIIPSYLTHIGSVVMACLANIRWGVGHHGWDLAPLHWERTLLAMWITEILITVSLSFTKISICYFYLRLFSTSSFHRYRKVVHVLMVLAALWGIGFVVAIVFQCRPVKAFWVINLPGEHCANKRLGIILHASLDIAVDVALYLLPIPRVLGLKLQRRQKVLVIALFALGAFVCACSAVRIPMAMKSVDDYDFTWSIWTSLLWTDLECALAVTVASLPSLTPLILKILPTFGGSSSRPDMVQEHAVRKAPPNLSYPLGAITTTATGAGMPEGSEVSGGGGGWWGGSMKSHMMPGNESEERIIQREGGNGAESEVGITKTTFITQKIEGQS